MEYMAVPKNVHFTNVEHLPRKERKKALNVEGQKFGQELADKITQHFSTVTVTKITNIAYVFIDIPKDIAIKDIEQKCNCGIMRSDTPVTLTRPIKN